MAYLSKVKKYVGKAMKLKYLQIKSALDIIFSVILIVLMTPVFLIIGIFIFLDSGWPIFFKQKRVGKNGKIFNMWKFRSMPLTHNNHPNVNREWTNGIPDDFIYETSSPKGITKLSYFLRKTSLDELPQLINVIKGDMSFIGPRPEVPEFTRYYNQNQNNRLKVKPGLSGLAQINGRSSITHGEKIKWDNTYVENVSFTLDFKILFKTFWKVVMRKDSY